MKTYNVYCVITKEVDFGLIDFEIIVRGTNIVDAAHKVERLLEKIDVEYDMTEIQLKEE